MQACTGSSLADTVWKLTRDGGFSNAETLHFVDDDALEKLRINDHDRPLVLLAAWLHALNMHQYGPGLVSSGFTSLASFATSTDETLQKCGVVLMGHRRVLLRQIREDLALRADVVDVASLLQQRQYQQVDAAQPAEAAEPAAAKRELPGATTSVDLEMKFANREAWHEPWKVTAEACLTSNGGGYYPARTPREIALACADGTVLHLC